MEMIGVDALGRKPGKQTESARGFLTEQGKRQFAIRIAPHVHFWLKQEAIDRGLSIQALVSEIIDERYLKEVVTDGG